MQKIGYLSVAQPCLGDGLLAALAIGNQHGGRLVRRHGQAHILGGYCAPGGQRKHAEHAVGFQHRRADFMDVHHPIGAHGLQQVGYRHAYALELVVLDAAVQNQHARRAVEQAAKGWAFHAQQAGGAVHDHQRGNGHQAVGQRGFGAGHRAGGQVGNQDSQHQLVGLKLADLPLAHQAHRRHGNGVENDCAKENCQHAFPSRDSICRRHALQTCFLRALTLRAANAILGNEILLFF